MARASHLLMLPTLLLAGCVGLPAQVHQAAHNAGAVGLAPRAAVFVADGAGGFQAASASLRKTAADDGLPLLVETFDWTHGHWRILTDHVDHGHIVQEGALLAQAVCAYRRAHPDVPVSLVGHSAGCDVVLTAAESLPPGSVERIVLLAPAVSAERDLRPALACARASVDAFHSKSDWFYLGLGVALFGTSDRHRAPAAGRIGFRPTLACPEDAALFAKLHQYPWDECLTWTGHRGGHYGVYQPQFLRAAVLPLLLPADSLPH